MPTSPDRNSSLPPFKKPHQSRQDLLALKNVFLKMRLQSLSNSSTPPSEPDETLNLSKTETLNPPTGPDYTSLLSDKLLLIVLSKLPTAHLIPDSLVCKRWSRLIGSLVRTLKLLEWDFLESGRLVHRFPNLVEIDIAQACIGYPRNSGILISNKFLSLRVNSSFSNPVCIRTEDLVRSEVIDRGLQILAQECLNLRKLVLIGASEEGLSCMANECQTLQEMELHCCTDMELRGISGCRNLQILRLVGSVDGLYESVISDVGLTFLAQGCSRLVKLELVGCEGSYDGIKAIGQCCQMLEELTLHDHKFEGGWLAGLSYCGNLKTLKLQSCRTVDGSPGPNEHLGFCPTLEELQLQRCHLREKKGILALFSVCETVRELLFVDCWGLDNNIFSTAAICRRVTFLSLEGCSLLNMEGLEPVVLSWKELTRLTVVSCNSIKDAEITPKLADLFSALKELKWRPDSRSLLSAGLVGTGIGQKGGRTFKRK